MNQFRYRLAQFMQGRYGVDQLTRFMNLITFILIIINLFVPSRLLWYLVLVLIILTYYRMFSRNIAQRYRENQAFMKYYGRFQPWWQKTWYGITHWKEERARNKGYHIYRCPQCKQKIRIPKGRGHIMVTCPKCHFEFHKKS